MRECSRSDHWPSGHDFSVASWNLLAECNYREDYDDEGKYVPWSSTRWPAQRRWLSRFANCDVICCQEMCVQNALPLISEHLRQSGFAQIVQDRSNFPFVNVTFYKEKRLRPMWSDHRSRALISCFADDEGREICIVNVHLQAGASKDCEKQRTCQLSSALKRVEKSTKGSIVVCGDFNSSLEESSELTKLMVGKGLTCAPIKGITFSCSGYWDTLDHIWTSPDLSNQLVSSSPSPELTLIMSHGMPSANYPSDHLPLAAAFAWQQKNGSCNLGMVLASSAPLCASPEIAEEWANICWYANAAGGKKAVREQKSLEKAFLQLRSEEEAAALKVWREVATEVAHTLVSRAGGQALLKFSGLKVCFDPGGANTSVPQDKPGSLSRGGA